MKPKLQSASFVFDLDGQVVRVSFTGEWTYVSSDGGATVTRLNPKMSRGGRVYKPRVADCLTLIELARPSKKKNRTPPKPKKEKSEADYVSVNPIADMHGFKVVS